jgi:hypothetical protein
MRRLIKEKVFNFVEMEGNVFKWHLLSGEMNLEDYKKGYEFAKECNYKGTGLFLMATHDQDFSFSPEAWEFMTDKKTDFSFMAAHALVINQLHLRMLATFFIRLKKNSYPSKVFSNEEKANVWLKSLMS